MSSGISKHRNLIHKRMQVPHRATWVTYDIDPHMSTEWETTPHISTTQRIKQYSKEVQNLIPLTSDFGELTQLKTRVENLETIVSRLVENHPPAISDPHAAWMENNMDTVLKYAGQRIAVHPTKGIVAANKDITKLYAKIEELGLMDEVSFEYIPKE